MLTLDQLELHTIRGIVRPTNAGPYRDAVLLHLPDWATGVKIIKDTLLLC